MNLRNLNGEKGMRGDESDDQLEEITTSMVEMARLNFSHPLEVRGEGPLDAVAMGLRALGEELQAALAARDEAQRANAGKVAFLLDMSHELRTCTVIISFVAGSCFCVLLTWPVLQPRIHFRNLVYGSSCLCLYLFLDLFLCRWLERHTHRWIVRMIVHRYFVRAGQSSP